MSDLDIIAQIEERIGKKLKKLGKIHLDSVGYQLNAQQRVIGLSLYKCELKEFPRETREIGQLQHLQTLWLFENQLKELPKEIGQLWQLKGLYLSSNKLTQLPKEISQLQQLQWLNLDSNQLTQLPKEICQLQQLQRLDLSSNELTQSPKEIGQLQQLQWLDLSRNQLTQLPKEIGQLQQLQWLDLSRNQLTQLPKEIGQLQHLVLLTFYDNQFTQFPKELLRLNLEIKWDKNPYGGGLHVESNPFEIPPVEIVKQGRQAIIDYYDKLDFQQEKHLKEELTESEVLEFLRKLIGTQEIPDEKTFWQQFKGSIELKIPFALGSIDVKKLVGAVFKK
jgi:Leucine rich repeat